MPEKKSFKEKSNPVNRGYKPGKSEHSIPKPKTVTPVTKPKKD